MLIGETGEHQESYRLFDTRGISAVGDGLSQRGQYQRRNRADYRNRHPLRSVGETFELHRGTTVRLLRDDDQQYYCSRVKQQS